MRGKTYRFIDLFAGLGGTRIGLEQALKRHGLKGVCVFTSEIKPHAIAAYKKNFNNEDVHGDITKIKASSLPDFDILLAGFPCQPFSSAGTRRGFGDTRGTLFFDIERILKEKKPEAFLLENVEGLQTHDRIDKKAKTGRTLDTILFRLEKLGYKTTWSILDASEHGVPQKRKRIYIVGTKKKEVDLTNLPRSASKLSDVLQKTIHKSKYLDSSFTKKLLKHFDLKDLYGKQIKDKRGGSNNIHSWDIALKGRVTPLQKDLLEALLKQRRRKSWAKSKGIRWSDGMPLTLKEIHQFFSAPKLRMVLDDLVAKGYVVFEAPKNATAAYSERGYNIVAGKLSYEISHILDPNKPTPTLVATDVTRLAVADKKGLRRLQVREGLRLFGFPEDYELEEVVSYQEAFNLLGNSVCVGTVELVADRLLTGLRR
jgi:DNA (cytosine-5)-methyltransferase 1